MTSFGTQYRAAEDPELIFQFGSSFAGSGGASSGGAGATAAVAGAGNTWADYVERDADMATLQGSVSSTWDETATLFSPLVKSDMNNNSAIGAGSGQVTGSSSSTRYTASREPVTPSEAPSLAAASTAAAGPRLPSATPKLNYTHGRRADLQTFSRYNNSLTASFSPEQLRRIERMAEEFWLRDTALTEDMFEDSSDEEE